MKTITLLFVALAFSGNLIAQEWTTYTTIDSLADNNVLSIAIDLHSTNGFAQVID